MHKQQLWVHHWRQDTLRRNWCWMSTSTTSRFKCVSATAVNQTQRLCVFTDQTVCTALPTFRPYTTIWGHYEWSNIFAPIWNFFKLCILALKETYLKTKWITRVHLAQYQNNFVSWVEFCLSPHVFFISQKECLITHLHESCCLVKPSWAKSHLVAPHWVGQQLLASTKYKESSAPKPGESISRT